LTTSSFSLSESTTVLARVLTTGGEWSPLQEASFAIVGITPMFLPGGNGDWTSNTNWNTAPSTFPNGTGLAAIIPPPTGANRNVDIRQPVTIGSLLFPQGASPFRNRVRDRSTGNSLTFDNGDDNAIIEVGGTGAGFVEFEVEAGSVLQSSLRLAVTNLVGSTEFGALRLRSAWSGPGGVIKSGAGIASFTGEDKNFEGPVVVEEGVLSVTQPSAFGQAASVSVHPGGQLRLTSASDPGPRVYTFGGPISLAGFGRGAEIPDAAGQGKLGALRYEPGSVGNVARVSKPVMLSGDTDIHVANLSNVLELQQPLTGAFSWAKTGGGDLHLMGGGSTGPVVVSNGMLRVSAPLAATVNLASSTATLTGHGSVGAISGQGTVRVNDARLDADGLVGTHVVFTANDIAGPTMASFTNTLNSVMVLPELPDNPLSITVYLATTGALSHVDIPVGFVMPHDEVIGPVLSGTPLLVYQHDENGSHLFEGVAWSLLEDIQLVAVPVVVPGSPGACRITALRLNGHAGTYARWRADAFIDPQEFGDDEISGPLAEREGVKNLLRYALNVPLGASPAMHTLTPERVGDTVRLRFPFDPGKTDVRWVVEGTANPADWHTPTIHFDSHAAPPEGHTAGWAWITCPDTTTSALFRLRLSLHP